MGAQIISTASAGGYPVVCRDGVGLPMLLITPFTAAGSAAWLKPRRTGTRPLAILGAADLQSLQTPAETVVRDLIDVAGWADAPSVLVVGYSAGGFAGLLLGAMLALALPACRVEVVVFSPIVRLRPDGARGRNSRHRDMLSQSRDSATASANLDRYGDARPWIRQAMVEAGKRFSIKLLYAEANEPDRRQAELLAETPCVTLLPMPTAQHSLYKFLVGRPDRETARAAMEEYLLARGGKTPGEAQAEAMALDAAFEAATAAHAEIRDVAWPRGAPVAAG